MDIKFKRLKKRKKECLSSWLIEETTKGLLITKSRPEMDEVIRIDTYRSTQIEVT
jgi:hypothetical protein